uniref:Putative LAGLIDADG homing endonuclease n=1 Tax=Dunaliella tertiolecta TaxID=3047 RepID=K7NSM0_DUNTE|nr:putative LAGLIDADG homing endonuclease [Dunaliella tertiolecta]
MNKNVDVEEKWNQWFAGLTDGDGCFYINKKEKSISYELTVHIFDSRVVYDIKTKLKAGSVLKRSNSNSIRYRVKSREVIENIVDRLNGRLYNEARIKQCEKVCQLLNKQYITPSFLLSKDDSYLAGLIDSDGSLTINISKSSKKDSQISGVEGRCLRLINSRGANQLRLTIASKYFNNVTLIQKSYKMGVIYTEKANKNNRCPNKKYIWTLSSYNDFQILYEYLKKFPLKSTKMHRMRLVLIYFKYKELKYHLKASDSLEFKLWSKFCKAWFKYSF